MINLFVLLKSVIVINNRGQNKARKTCRPQIFSLFSRGRARLELRKFSWRGENGTEPVIVFSLPFFLAGCLLAWRDIVVPARLLSLRRLIIG